MANIGNFLIVEGEADKSFFEALCQQHELHVTIQVSTPRDMAGRHNSKEGVFQALNDQLPELADQSTIKRIAMVVDADRVEDGKGFKRTVDRVSGLVSPYGYAVSSRRDDGGMEFLHGDGLPPIGLWVMPDNLNEGMLENWIGQCVHPDQAEWYAQAQSTVRDLNNPQFKEIRQPKADIATWMAWQEKPGEALYYCINGGLLDQTAPLYVGLVSWLKAVFE